MGRGQLFGLGWFADSNRLEGQTAGAIKVFFHCQTQLVATFREIYSDAFTYEGNRAVVIPLHADIGQTPLRHCLLLALQYRSLKHLPLLGA